jgi:hypothetical protein
MFRFSNGRAKTIWGSKGTNKSEIMDKGVLSRKIEALRANTACAKKFTIAVEPFKGIV